MPLPRGKDSGRITGKPEVISSPVGIVPTNALVLTGLATFRVVGKAEVTVGFDLRHAVH